MSVLSEVRQRLSIALILIAFVTTAFTKLVLCTPIFFGLGDRYVSDYQIATNSMPEAQDKSVVFVAITERTLERFTYRSPIDRKYLADLLTTLAKLEVRGILLDFLFDQPTEPEKDQLLKQTIDDLPIPIVVGYADQSEGLTTRQVNYLNNFLKPKNRGFIWGFSDRATDVMRGVYAGRKISDGSFVANAAAVLLTQLGETAHLPIPEDGLVLRYRGHPSKRVPRFAQYDAGGIDLVSPDMLKGKIVVVGGDLSLTDRHRAPFAMADKEVGEIPGALMHAYAVAQLLDGSTAPEVSDILALILIFGCAIIGVLVVSLPLPPLVQPLVVFAAIWAIWLAGFITYRYAGMLFPLVTPSCAMVLSAWLAGLYSAATPRSSA